MRKSNPTPRRLLASLQSCLWAVLALCLGNAWGLRTVDPLDLPKAERPILSESAEDAGYYFNARWYSPERGSFSGRDAALQFWTPYSYTGNGPLTGTDPDGKADLSLADKFSRRWAELARSSAIPDKDPTTFSVAAHSYLQEPLVKAPDWAMKDLAAGGPFSASPGGKDLSQVLGHFENYKGDKAWDASQLAQVIIADPRYKPGMPVELDICFAATNGLASDLAIALNARVKAAPLYVSQQHDGSAIPVRSDQITPTNWIWFGSNGSVEK